MLEMTKAVTSDESYQNLALRILNRAALDLSAPMSKSGVMVKGNRLISAIEFFESDWFDTVCYVAKASPSRIFDVIKREYGDKIKWAKKIYEEVKQCE